MTDDNGGTITHCDELQHCNSVWRNEFRVPSNSIASHTRHMGHAGYRPGPRRERSAEDEIEEHLTCRPSSPPHCHRTVPARRGRCLVVDVHRPSGRHALGHREPAPHRCAQPDPGQPPHRRRSRHPDRHAAQGPRAGPLRAPRPPAAPRTATYVVRSGDTVSDIALRLKVSPGVLLKLNHLDARGRIYPGQHLKVPASAVRAQAKAQRPHDRRTSVRRRTGCAAATP